MIGGLSIESRNHCVFIQLLNLSANWSLLWIEICQPPMCYCVVFESRNWSFGQKYWSLGDDLVHFHILHFICFNLVGYDLYQIWRRC